MSGQSTSEHASKKVRIENPLHFMPLERTSFVETIRRNRFFADKSSFIKEIDEAENVLFCRPRRFGKTLVLQMLQEYYDIRNAAPEKFDELFGSLWIGKKDGDKYVNKTRDQGRYIILSIDFNEMPEPDKSLRGIEYAQTFERMIIRMVNDCAVRYDLILRSEPETPAAALGLLTSAARKTPIYMFIDEYDTPVTNLVLRSSLTPEEKREDLILLRGRYNAFLKATKTYLPRLFLTGLTDMYISGLSGLTLAQSTFKPDWHALAGYTEADVKDLLAGVRDRLDEKDSLYALFEEVSILGKLKDAYNGYWFADTDRDQPRMYNADMVNYYVGFTLSRSRFPLDHEIVSRSHGISGNVLNFASSLSHFAGMLLVPPSNPISFTGSLSDSISVDNIMNVYFRLDQEKELFWKLLYFFGALTTQSVEKGGNNLMLGVPNQAVRSEYIAHLSELVDPKAKNFATAKESLKSLIKGDPGPFIESFTRHHFQITNYDRGGSDVNEGEAAFKTLLLVCLHFVKDLATVKNETRFAPVGSSTFGTYADIILLPKDESLPGIIIELKCVSIGQLDPVPKDFNKKIEDNDYHLEVREEEQILGMTYEGYLDSKEKKKYTIQKLLDFALEQVEDYRRKAIQQMPRKSGYKAWVFVRVGLERIIFRDFDKKQ